MFRKSLHPDFGFRFRFWLDSDTMNLDPKPRKFTQHECLMVCGVCAALLMNKDREILELKSSIAELLAVMPGMGSHNHVRTRISY